MGSTTTSYVYDANGSLPGVLTDGSRKYVYGLGLAYETDTAGNVQAVDHTDGLGSVRALTDASGNLTQTYQTDPFGVPTQTQGASSQPFEFTGQQQDAESSFVFLRARYYDPALGRFLSRDPLFGSIRAPASLNAYVYVQDDPLNAFDPSGLSSTTIGSDTGQSGGISMVNHDSYGANGIGFQSCDDPSTQLFCMGMVPGPWGLAAGILKNLDPGSESNDTIVGSESDGDLLFGQPSVSSRFGHGAFAGKTIGEVAAGLRDGTISPDQLPIDYVVRDGQRVAVNNRSLTAFRRAGIEPTILNNRTGDAYFEALVDRHLGGTQPSRYIRIRGGAPGTSNLE